MNKSRFIRALSRRLRALPREERQTSLAYYTEMIQDYMEEGMSEEQAVAMLGNVDEIAAQLLQSAPDVPKAGKGRRVWMIVLLVLGSPVWLSLLIAALAVAASVFVVLWSLAASMYAVELSLAVCGPAGLVGLVVGCLKGNAQQGVLLLSTGYAALGLALVLLPLLNRLTALLWRFTKWSARSLLRSLRGGVLNA